jgi:hypothetical protein
LAPSYPSLPNFDSRHVVAQLYRTSEPLVCWTVFCPPGSHCIVRRLTWDIASSPRCPDREPLIYAADARITEQAIRDQLSLFPAFKTPTFADSPSASESFSVTGVVIITDLTRVEVSWAGDAPDGLSDLAAWFGATRVIFDRLLPAYTDTYRGISFRISTVP